MKFVFVSLFSLAVFLPLHAAEKSAATRKPASGSFGCFENTPFGGATIDYTSTANQLVPGACNIEKPFSVFVVDNRRIAVCCTGK